MLKSRGIKTVQMDEIHAGCDISYLGRIIWSKLTPDDLMIHLWLKDIPPFPNHFLHNGYRALRLEGVSTHLMIIL